MKRLLFAAASLAAFISSHSAPLSDRKEIRLKEVTVEASNRQVLHTLGYVREFSELTTGSDTVFLFREKWVDFMSPEPAAARKFSGWRLPRVLSSKSYFRFTNAEGLDSVSDRFNQHFSWSDWIQIPNRVQIPTTLGPGTATDTIFGRHRPTEIWRRQNDRIDLSVNVLADTASRRWAPTVSAMLNRDIDFERLDIRYLFKNVGGEMITERDLDAMTVRIESNGRGADLSRLSRRRVPFYVTTYMEMYVADREFLSVSQARNLERNPLAETDLLALAPAAMTDLDEQTLRLIERVENLDTIGARTNLPVDKNLVGRSLVPLSRKQKIVRRLRGMLGLPMQKYDKSKKIF